LILKLLPSTADLKTALNLHTCRRHQKLKNWRRSAVSLSASRAVCLKARVHTAAR